MTAKNVVAWALSVLLALAFLAAGVSKLAGAQMMVDGFRHWGYADWFRYLIGACEVGGAVLLLMPRTAWLGAAGLCVIMIGAVVTHLTHSENAEALIPLAMFVLLAAVGYLRCPAWMRAWGGPARYGPGAGARPM
jgi:putative oxidoreductase